VCYAAAIPWIMAGISAVGAYQQAAGQKAQAKYQAGVAANNAKLAEMQADDAEARGNKAAQDMRRKYVALQGTQRAALAARGLDISDGSANATLQDTAFFGAMDEETVRANAAREAWGYRVRGANFDAEAAANSNAAAAANPLLSGGLAFGSVASKWYRGQGNDWAGWGGSASDPWYG
jgi:hypothetical protein